MSTYSNWYQHDFDAGNDPKIMQLEMLHGLEGYGLYHRILEHMCTADDHSLTIEEINFIAKKCFCKIENCCDVFLKLGLFLKLKSGKIYSKSLKNRLAELDEKHKKRVIAGSKGGKKKSSNAKAKLGQGYKPKSSNALPLEKSRSEKIREEKSTRDIVTKTKNPPAITKAIAKPKKAIKKTITSETWTAYSNAYNARYGVMPVRNAQVNGQLKKFVERIGEKDAPFVAAYYLSSQNGYYLSRGHSVGILLADAEKNRTEWATGRKITQSGAREADRLQGAGDNWQEIIDEMGDKNE